ncbi:hypothetical protein ACGTJS_10760 [Faucicola mancuniensis]|uniref:hypothetical protein n=1 Tax=Faucicola mancuniensis TaxID=1309795 RepID=UPI0039775680
MKTSDSIFFAIVFIIMLAFCYMAIDSMEQQAKADHDLVQEHKAWLQQNQTKY